MIEQDGHLLIAFSGAKQTMEVLKVSLADIDRLIDQNPPLTGVTQVSEPSRLPAKRDNTSTRCRTILIK
jgi:hypothetical protein